MLLLCATRLLAQGTSSSCTLKVFARPSLCIKLPAVVMTQRSIASFFAPKAQPSTVVDGQIAAAAEPASKVVLKEANHADTGTEKGKSKRLRKSDLPRTKVTSPLRSRKPASPAAAAATAMPADSDDAVALPKRRRVVMEEEEDEQQQQDQQNGSKQQAAAQPQRSPSPAASGEGSDSPSGKQYSSKKVSKSSRKRSESPPAQDGLELDNAADKSGVGKVTKAASAKGSDKVEGVGALAQAAAAQHGSFDSGKIANWKAGQPVPFSFLADAFECIGEESKRLAIISILVNTFRSVIALTPGDLLPLVYLCTNRVAPAHEGMELGLGDATIIKALAEATGRKEAVIKKQYDEEGDLGSVAAKSRTSQGLMFKPAALTVAGVFKTFKEIAGAEGKNSQDRKRGLIVKLLVASRGVESGYIIRALQGKLRIGLAEQSVLVALAHAATLEQGVDKHCKGSDLANELEKAAQLVKQAYSECPSFDDLVPALLKHPIEELPQHVHFRPGVPVKPMLAKPTNGVSEVLDKFSGQEFTCEYKYDGERAQVHVLEDGSIKIYSRNAENNTSKYPDIVALIQKVVAAGTKSIVFDSEAVAFDRETNKILPFQVLSTRARKDVKLDNIKVQVCLYAFDCLYLNGEALLQKPLTERRSALYGALTELPGHMHFATYKTSHDTEELAAFLDESVTAGTEGLIVKTMDATYEPSKRSVNWLKLKKDYLEGVGDTFDVVPIGAWWGKGKRTGVFGAYLLAVYSPDDEEYQTISKIGTGFSEEQLKELADSLNTHTIAAPHSYYRYGETLVPDVWFDAKVVWEVKAADLSISPVHQAATGLVDPNKGISIRFPRLVRVRDDKGPEDATSAEQVADMYKKQALLANKQKAVVDDDEA